MCGRKLFALFIIALLVQPISVIKAADIVQRCAEGITKIRSYDVTYSTEFLNYPNPTKPDKANLPVSTDTSKRHDTLAFGLGRRCEDFIGTSAHTISVVDWQTACSRGDKMPAIISGLQVDGYLDLFNPVCWGAFLADLLRDKKSTIHMLDTSSSPKGLIGFEVKHPQMRGPVRVWADTDHGYMPSTIEIFIVDKNGRAALWNRIHVEEFIQIGDGAWAPVRGTYEAPEGTGLNTGVCYAGASLVVNVKQSSWNSINSGKLFTAASMPEVNYVMPDNGYKMCLPPSTLAAIKQADQSVKDSVAQALTQGKSSRLLLLTVSVLTILLIAVLVWRTYRRRKSNAAP